VEGISIKDTNNKMGMRWGAGTRDNYLGKNEFRKRNYVHNKGPEILKAGGACPDGEQHHKRSNPLIEDECI
jgi:hypothetical protein